MDREEFCTYVAAERGLDPAKLARALDRMSELAALIGEKQAPSRTVDTAPAAGVSLSAALLAGGPFASGRIVAAARHCRDRR